MPALALADLLNCGDIDGVFGVLDGLALVPGFFTSVIIFKDFVLGELLLLNDVEDFLLELHLGELLLGELHGFTVSLVVKDLA